MARKLGEFLVAEGFISEAILDRALEIQGTQARGLRLGAILLRWGLLPEKALLEILSRLHRCAAVDWKTLSSANQEAIGLLSAPQAQRLGAVPYAVDRKTVRVAFSNPSNLTALDEVASITRRRVIPTVTTEVRLLQAQQRFYRLPLGRDVWAIVQKMERPAPPRVAALHVPPAPRLHSALLSESEPESRGATPDETQPPSLSIDTGETLEPDSSLAATVSPVGFPETLHEDSVALEPVVEDLFEAIPPPQTEVLSVSAEAVDDQMVPVVRVDDGEPGGLIVEELPLERLLSDRLDPFADETPLADFIEQALAFYERQPAFRCALDALDEGPVENLDCAVDEEEKACLRIELDDTHPSWRRRSSQPAPELPA